MKRLIQLQTSNPDFSLRSFFVDKARKIHIDNNGNQKYNYDLVVYKNSSTKVKLICPIHGVFEQTPSHHTGGQGCKKCGREKSALGRMKTQDELIKELRNIWGDRLDFSKVKYKNCYEQLEIICPEHGMFKTTSTNLLQKRGCKKCSLKGRSLKRTHFRIDKKEELIKQCQDILGDNFEILDVTFGNSKVAKIKTFCKNHKLERWQTIRQVLNGHKGCEKCGYKERSKTRHKNHSLNNECLSETLSPRIREILKEWDYNKNDPYSPENLTEGSDRNVWWKCSRCGNEYQMVVRTRAQMMYHFCEKCNPVSLNRSSLPSNIIFYELKKLLSDSEIVQEYKKEFKPYSWDMRIIFHDRHIVYCDYDGRYHLTEKNKKGDAIKNKLGADSGGDVWRIIEYSALKIEKEGVYYTEVDGNRFKAQSKREVDKIVNDLKLYFINHLTRIEKENLLNYLPLTSLQNEMELHEKFKGNLLDKDLLITWRIKEEKTIGEILLELDKIGKTCSKIKLMRNLRFYNIYPSKEQKSKIFLRLPSAKKKQISQWTLDGKHVADYNSISIAKNLFKNWDIGDCVNGKRESAMGFLWTPKGVLPKPINKKTNTSVIS